MAFIDWSPSFSVGSVILDADHKKLLGMLNGIYDAWDGGAGTAELNTLFDQLLDYTEEHFTREERRLMDRGFPGLAAHHAAHENLRELVMAFRSRYLAGLAPEQLTEDVTKFLKSWLLDHILGEDMKYKELFTIK